MAMNAGFAAYLAKKKGAKTTVKSSTKVAAKTVVKKVDKLTPGDSADMPMVKMTSKMMDSIKSSPKGKVPAGLAKYMKSKKK